LPVRGATAAASDVGVMSGIPDISIRLSECQISDLLMFISR